MLGKRKHKDSVDYVEPDLPITPMLDMSFQLLAFFIMTFQPMPTEGQLLLALPKIEGSQSATATSDLNDDKPIQVTVRATADLEGRLAGIYLEDKDVAGGVSTTDLKTDHTRYMKELQDRFKTTASGKPSKLSLEIDPKLLQEYVVPLIDEAFRAGYRDISTIPNTSKK